MHPKKPSSLDAVRAHVHRRGYREGEGINNFVPHDPVAAFGMAGYLLREHAHDVYLAVAPEGHIYGFFLEQLGARVDECWVDYPPTVCRLDLPAARVAGKRVLLIEDDVASGRTLRLVLAALLPLGPAAVDLYLGHSSGVQRLRNVPPEIGHVFLAGQVANVKRYAEWLAAFRDHWGDLP